MELSAFKPRKANLFPAVVAVALVWGLFALLVRNSCKTVQCLAADSCEQFSLHILPKCCPCNTPETFIAELVFVIIVPFVLVYGGSSILQRLKMSSPERQEKGQGPATSKKPVKRRTTKRK